MQLPVTPPTEFESALADDAASVVLGELGRPVAYYRMGKEPGALTLAACTPARNAAIVAPGGAGIRSKPIGDVGNQRVFSMMVLGALPGAVDAGLGTDADPASQGRIITLADGDQFDVPGHMVGRPAMESVRVKVAGKISYTPGLWQCEVVA